MTAYPGPEIYAAIDSAIAERPYYRAAIRRVRFEPDPSVPTMATSAQWVTHYNPATVAEWTTAECGRVIIHEVEHLLRRHAERCGEREHGRFNVAADAEINQRIDGLPSGAIYPATLGMPNGRTAETYYGAAGGPKPKSNSNSGDGEPGEDGESSGGGMPGADGESSGEPGEGTGSGQPGDGPQVDCGSAAGGEPRPWEAGDAPNVTPEAAEAIRREVAAEARQVGPGQDPGGAIREWAESELGIDRTAWYRAIAAAVSYGAAQFGTPTRWTWPGRRDPRDVGGAVLPRWTGERPSAAVIIDTSSSIEPGDLDMAMAAGEFLGKVADVTYYGCDVRPTKYGRTLPTVLYGGGGTLLTAGIDAAITDGARLVIVITDCETPWPDEPTSVPLIVGANASDTARGILNGTRGRYMPPTWATVVPVREG